MSPKKKAAVSASGRTGTAKPVRTPKKAPNPKCLANLRPAWVKGVSGNPGGRPKRDIAAEIAQAVFEENADVIKRAMAKKLRKGDARLFTALGDRAYGKAHQQVDITGQVFISVSIDL